MQQFVAHAPVVKTAPVQNQHAHRRRKTDTRAAGQAENVEDIGVSASIPRLANWCEGKEDRPKRENFGGRRRGWILEGRNRGYRMSDSGQGEGSSYDV